MKAFCAGLIGIAGLIAASSSLAASADETYKSSCGFCHDSGVANAPKPGDKAAWEPRIKQGREALYKSAVEGKAGTAMTAKGGFANLSDAEVKAVVDLMLAKVQ